MEFSSLSAVSPVDGRYRQVAEKLADYFSEGTLGEAERYITGSGLPRKDRLGALPIRLNNDSTVALMIM